MEIPKFSYIGTLLKVCSSHCGIDPHNEGSFHVNTVSINQSIRLQKWNLKEKSCLFHLCFTVHMN